MAAWVQIPHPAPNVEHTDHILNFLWFLKKEGYKESTILNYSKSLRDIAKHVNLDDPEAVKDYIAKKPVSDARKEIIVNCYDKYCKWRGIPFKKPKYYRDCLMFLRSLTLMRLFRLLEKGFQHFF